MPVTFMLSPALAPAAVGPVLCVQKSHMVFKATNTNLKTWRTLISTTLTTNNKETTYLICSLFTLRLLS